MRSFWRHTSIWCTKIKRFAQLLYHLRCRTKQHNENLIPFEVQNGLIIYLMIFFLCGNKRFFLLKEEYNIGTTTTIIRYTELLEFKR